jgi:P-loop Domain of unknown function (DUF2791)
MGFATSEVQIAATETPRHRLETVYRRLAEQLATADTPQGALRNIIDGWFFTLEEDVLAEGVIAAHDVQGLLQRTNDLLEQRLARVISVAPMCSAALRVTLTGSIVWPASKPRTRRGDLGGKAQGRVSGFGCVSRSSIGLLGMMPAPCGPSVHGNT